MDSLLLLSGGLDSCVLLTHLLSLGKRCVCLSFDYGQRHKIELEYAKKQALHYNLEHHVIKIDPFVFASAQSSLVNTSVEVQRGNTYVPARNLLFIAHAISFAEARSLHEMYIGANREDIDLFPDCRREFFDALQHAAHLGTRAGSTLTVKTPFATFSKREIIELGEKLSAPMDMSFSCYDPQQGGLPCGACQACALRNLRIYSNP